MHTVNGAKSTSVGHIVRMAYIRTKRVKKNGKTYTYQVRQMSVREGKRVRTIHLGMVGGSGREEGGWLRRQVQPEPGMYLGLKMQAESEKFLQEKASAKAEAPVSKQLDGVAPDSVTQAGEHGEAGGSDVGEK